LSFRLSRRSLDRLQGVHPDLVRVVQRAIRITPIDFVVLEGLRTEARQRELVAAGASRTMRSRHLTGHAVDIAPWVGTVRWDWPLFDQLAPAIKQAASEEGVPVTWGGDWRTFKDGPHWELPRSKYPSNP
jgi:peptidoglycan L-alanyl-D-glutamate endopeptidase CwlK